MSKKSLYGQYIEEKENRYILEGKDYFLTYQFDREWVYIVDMFVVSGKRTNGIMTKISEQCEQLARDKGYTQILGSVDINTNQPEIPALAMIKHGYKFYKLVGSIIYFLKNIKEEND